MIDAHPVIPAKAGTQLHRGHHAWGFGRSWIPAFAGMTVVGLALAGCGSKSTDRTAAIPNPTQAAADAAAAAYSACVDKAAATIDVHADQPATLTDKAMKSCIAERATAVAKVQAAEMARGGDPMITAEVAERSVRVADDELRDRANATIVTRKLSDTKAS